MTSDSAPRVVVAILTYRRPAELESCLAAVQEHLDAMLPAASILVIDNDPAASAREAVQDAASASARVIQYRVEPHPGIAAARNRALDEAGHDDLLVFLDDDERPTAQWIVPLIETWRVTAAAAVMGRVVSVFASPLDPWVAAGEFFRRRRMPTGTAISVGAAGNLLLDLATVRRLGVRFDERLALGAGEDSLFTTRLTRAGGRMVWCDESVATDHVPAERMTRSWVLERARSHGNTEAVVDLLLATTRGERAWLRARSAARGSARVAAGLGRYAVGIVIRSLRHQARGLRTAYRGIGIASAAAGVVVQEYARDERQQAVSTHA